jgi:flagellum-specific ATP synthase
MEGNVLKKISFDQYRDLLNSVETIRYTGKVTQVIGLTIEAQGPPVEIGELCYIYNAKGTESIQAEVVGFRNDKVLLMPLGDLQGIGPGSWVMATRRPFSIPVGKSMAGRVLDGLGRPIDGLGDIQADKWVSVNNSPPNPLERKRISSPLLLGVRSIDSLMTCGQGQRMGIFAGSGVGKSTLLGMIARNAKADINVIALIGERGREVREFIEKDLKEEGLKRSVVIAATSDQPAMIRVKGVLTATAIAEYFRDQGKNTILMMDSVTRFAMAQREVGLAIGEPPVARGYTPSVFAQLPKILERAGNSQNGSITGLYTVLVDGDDMNEPISDAVRGILDGHIILSRELANKNHYPAIDVLSSLSRVMPDLTSLEQRQLASRIRSLLSIYKQSQDLINIGAYQKGTNKEIDEAILRINSINKFLQQSVDEVISFEDTQKMMRELFQ